MDADVQVTFQKASSLGMQPMLNKTRKCILPYMHLNACVLTPWSMISSRNKYVGKSNQSLWKSKEWYCKAMVVQIWPATCLGEISSFSPCSLGALLNDAVWQSLQRPWRLMGWWSLGLCWFCSHRKPVCLPCSITLPPLSGSSIQASQLGNFWGTGLKCFKTRENISSFWFETSHLKAIVLCVCLTCLYKQYEPIIHQERRNLLRNIRSALIQINTGSFPDS